jgi:hypothetical protein
MREPVRNVGDLPLILKIGDMEAVYRISHRTIRRQLEQGEFTPTPYDKYPYRWRRQDVINDLNAPSRKLRRRPHGFATTKRRRDDDDTSDE